MCGRYIITSAPEAMQALFGYRDRPNFPPRYNVAPTQPVPIVRMMAGERRFALVRWGLIPSWVKDPRKIGLLINARGESVNDKPAFRAAMRRRRCLFPADGFYEWKVEGKARRPFLVRLRTGGPMAFAGLWETWTGPEGGELESAVILTTAANRTLSALHERMPAVVAADAFDFWLDSARVDAATAAALIAPAPDALFEFHEVSPAVNRVASDSPDLIAPIGTPAPPRKPRSARTTGPGARNDDGQASLL